MSQALIKEAYYEFLLNINTIHIYRINLHQDLHGTDFENHVTFCQWMLHQMHINNKFFH